MTKKEMRNMATFKIEGAIADIENWVLGEFINTASDIASGQIFMANSLDLISEAETNEYIMKCEKLKLKHLSRSHEERQQMQEPC